MERPPLWGAGSTGSASSSKTRTFGRGGGGRQHHHHHGSGHDAQPEWADDDKQLEWSWPGTAASAALDSFGRDLDAATTAAINEPEREGGIGGALVYTKARFLALRRADLPVPEDMERLPEVFAPAPLLPVNEDPVALRHFDDALEASKLQQQSQRPALRASVPSGATHQPGSSRGSTRAPLSSSGASRIRTSTEGRPTWEPTKGGASLRVCAPACLGMLTRCPLGASEGRKLANSQEQVGGVQPLAQPHAQHLLLPPQLQQPLHPGQLQLQQPVHPAAQLHHPLQPPIATSWEYRDNDMNIQGPFDREDMCEWYSMGYLPLHLEIRRRGDTAFVKLIDLLAVSPAPFDSYEPLDIVLQRQRAAAPGVVWSRGASNLPPHHAVAPPSQLQPPLHLPHAVVVPGTGVDAFAEHSILRDRFGLAIEPPIAAPAPSAAAAAAAAAARPLKVWDVDQLEKQLVLGGAEQPPTPDPIASVPPHYHHHSLEPVPSVFAVPQPAAKSAPWAVKHQQPIQQPIKSLREIQEEEAAAAYAAAPAAPAAAIAPIAPTNHEAALIPSSPLATSAEDAEFFWQAPPPIEQQHRLLQPAPEPSQPLYHLPPSGATPQPAPSLREIQEQEEAARRAQHKSNHSAAATKKKSQQNDEQQQQQQSKRKWGAQAAEEQQQKAKSLQAIQLEEAEQERQRQAAAAAAAKKAANEQKAAAHAAPAPVTSAWATAAQSAPSNTSASASSSLSLAEIQEIEMREREQQEKLQRAKRKLEKEQQKQQLQQQQQQAGFTWAKSTSSGPSLFEIQQEELRKQQELKKRAKAVCHSSLATDA